MTAPDYATQVAELLREHSWQRVDTAGRVTCRGDSGEHVYTGIDHEQHQAEVLAAAGLIPTSVEWGVRVARRVVEYGPNDADAAAYAASTGWVLVSRAVTDWKDATDE